MTQIKEPGVGPQPETPAEPTRMEEFSKTSTAANLSGHANGAMGFFKKKLGEFTDNPELGKEGRNQQILGKVHRIVGSIREVRELATQRALNTRDDGKKILKKHGEKLLDQTLEFFDDIKKTFL